MLSERKRKRAHSMKKTTINKKEIVEELRKQDEQLKAIFERREELAKIAKEAGCHDKIWEMLFSDHEAHYSF
jgi:hypothetical protein